MIADLAPPYTLDEIIEIKIAHARRNGSTPAECETIRSFTLAMAKTFSADFVISTFALEIMMQIKDGGKIQQAFAGNRAQNGRSK